MKKTTGAIEVAHEVVTELNKPLAEAGIPCPPPGPEAVALAADPPRPLVAMGCHTVDSARPRAAAVPPGEENRS
ncbi:hypothetical protein EAO70_35670 [Streptomyces sp. adm13(2018)]|uniref:hypothetical protein n=1 Tax=unclassified Streptomyces TaxID=2593676 RepID=UPI0013A2ECCC|nr:hypothetical protein [Streptomyces sp. adm13(2018)]TXS07973.1 hypothetical protein EAO70_35670 [Streptomyces sp. adm13(2018)]